MRRKPGSSRSFRRESRLPLKECQFDAPGGIENDTLLPEKTPLKFFMRRASGETDLALRVNHAMPGHATIGRQRGQGIAGPARLSRNAREVGDLAVGCDSSARDSPYHFIDAIVSNL